jgi:uncharacterized membrane protein YraQ (UPF0718 family)
MTLLLLSIAMLLLGPLAYRSWSQGHALGFAVDGFVFVAISGLVLFLVLPETVVNGGWWALGWAAAGALGPTFTEQAFHGLQRRTHNAALVLGIAGIGFHGVLDGAALSQGTMIAGGLSLPLAIILHRIPVGMAIWWLVRPSFGSRTSALVIGFVILATVGGYAMGPSLLEHASLQAVAWFEALVAGALVHVVVHRTQHDASGGTPQSRRLEGLGALAGLVLLVVLIWVEKGDGGSRSLIGTSFLSLALESAPALVLAYLMAGLMSVFLPHSSVIWMGRGGKWQQALRGMTIGLPLPICSCGVVPLYRSLVLRGAPLAAAMAFLVATPELGLDAIFLSVPLLGAKMTIIRVIGAMVVALTVGWVVAKVAPAAETTRPLQVAEQGLPEEELAGRLQGALRVGFGEVVDHTAPWILLGLAIAAVATPLVDTGMLATIPRGLDVVVFALIGLPIYVCAAAATPLVAVLLAGGVSPGAALAFLLTGPATNVTTFGVLNQLHGRRVALAFSVTIIGLSLVLGWVVNLIVPEVHGITLTELRPEGASPIKILSLSVLVLAILGSVLRRGARRFVGEIGFRIEVPGSRTRPPGH